MKHFLITRTGNQKSGSLYEIKNIIGVCKMIHHGFKQGKKVLIILNTGEHIVGKFKGSSSNYIELEDRKIKWGDIRSSTIYKDRKTKQFSVQVIKDTQA